MRTLNKKGMRIVVWTALVAVLVTLAALTVSADEYSAAAILSSNGQRRDYATMEAAIEAAGSGDTLVILNDWVPTASVTFPSGVTITVPNGVCAGNESGDVVLTVLGTLKSSGTLIGNWQLQGNVTISWDLDGDGTVDERQVVAYGETPSHAAGSRPREGVYVYRFAGWDKTLKPATADVTYTARFTRVVTDFTVGWDLDGNGTVDITGTYPQGQTPVPPCDGSRPDDNAKIYTFIGWDSEIKPVTADVVYTALFTSVPRTYNISFDTDGDGDVDVTYVKAYGAPLMPSNGYRAATDDCTFTFSGWLPALQDVTADAIYYAQFNAVSKNNNTVHDGALTVSMLNMMDEGLPLLVTLQSGRTVYAAVPLSVGAGMNETAHLSGLPDGRYTLTVSNVNNGGCLYVGIAEVTGGTGSCAVMMSGLSPVFKMDVDDSLAVAALDLPESWLNRTAAAGNAGLTEQDWQSDTAPMLALNVKVYGSEGPFRETLEMAAGSQTIALCMSVGLTKTVGENVTELTRIPEIVTIFLSISDEVRERLEIDKSSLTLYRVSTGVTDKLTTVPNMYGEYFTLEDNGILRLCLRSSAIYALAYDAPDSGFPLWWILMLVDVAGAYVLYYDRKKRPLDYPVRLSVALGLTVMVVLILSLRQSVMEIIFASLGWLLLTLLICLSGSGNHNRDKSDVSPVKFGEKHLLPDGQTDEVVTEKKSFEMQLKCILEKIKQFFVTLAKDVRDLFVSLINKIKGKKKCPKKKRK